MRQVAGEWRPARRRRRRCPHEPTQGETALTPVTHRPSSHIPWSARCRPKGTRLLIELLEDRTLLSVSGPLDLNVLAANPYDPATILVRFQSEATRPEAGDILSGTTLGPELPLVPGL